MLRIWCVLLIPDTEDILLPPLYSEVECQPKRSMNRCWMSKIKTHPISLNGFPTTSNHPSVISHPRDSRWLSPSSETQLPSKKCSKEWLNNSLLCSEERLSSIGTQEKVWMKWNSLKQNQTWTTWYPNINNIRMQLQKKKTNMMKKKQLEITHKQNLFLYIIYIKCEIVSWLI